MSTIIDLLSEDSNVIEHIKTLMTSPKNFEGPSVYFHQKAIECARNDKEFLGVRHMEYIYATLVSWGMHRMGPKGAKMPAFKPTFIGEPNFSDSILKYEKFFRRWKGVSIETISQTEFEDFLRELTTVCFEIQATTLDSRLVSSSKTLAHILPDLVPPIDRQYTLQFFYGTKSHPINDNKYGEEVFKKVMTAMYNFYQNPENVKNATDYLNDKGQKFCDSLPKIFDNIIVNYISKKDKKSK